MGTHLFETFNKDDTFLVISGYPARDKAQSCYGISWYTKETLEPVAKTHESKFIVLAETNHNNEPQVTCNGNILILRVFDQRHPTIYPRILKWLSIFNNVKNVHIHSEFSANGGVVNMLLQIPFLLLIAMKKCTVTYYAHNLLLTLKHSAPHLNLDKRLLPIGILNTVLKIYYRLLGSLSSRIVVLDEAIKKRARLLISPKKLVALPLYVTKKIAHSSRETARQKLGIGDDEKILISFGFVTWYKGADWLIDSFARCRENKSKTRLILVGGKAHSLTGKPYYEEYFQKLQNEVREYENIEMTGFLPENEVDTYFQAADLVVYPYRDLIGSSGALTYAYAHHKPFLTSSSLLPLFDNQELIRIFQKCGLKPEKLAFTLDDFGMSRILKTISSSRKLKTLRDISEEIAQARSFTSSLRRYREILFPSTRDAFKPEKTVFQYVPTS